ncbi:MAG TPA: phage tail protein, partial [Porphyromonadaceae bacterium]|nr:phage tail protein [Porphyromonadaceae bacterium]HBG79517.1 phage tail protein [Porphyromonadaceae bacterium]HBK95684.1 phage tail protein [Porphyromonadaceae bacterium]HBQ56792.1 phage tail protein [Porphyromonadaceae bacterium]HCB87755.1 phage tail protein [Porphyromonadaceae bacterium]
EKKTAVNMLVQASVLKEAVEIVETEMKKTMVDYTFASVNETAIMDVFKYSAGDNSKAEE